MTNTKLPIKLAEVAVQRFNAPASGVPHHVGLLAGHRASVERCLAAGDWDKVRREQINATRVIKQLKCMLVEMAELRERIRDADVPKYDELVRPGRERALAAINAYLQIDLTKPTNRYTDDDDDDYLNHIDDHAASPQQRQQQQQQHQLPAIECDFNPTAHQLQTKKACLHELELLHRDLEDLHGIFHRLHGGIAAQADAVTTVETNVEHSQAAVAQGEQHLRQALSYRKAMYPMAGALLGTCLGGPVGLLAGLKVGGIAAIGCGFLGFTGGAAIKNSEAQQARDQLDSLDAEEAGLDHGVEATSATADRKND